MASRKALGGGEAGRQPAFTLQQPGESVRTPPIIIDQIRFSCSADSWSPPLQSRQREPKMERRLDYPRTRSLVCPEMMAG